MALPIPAAGPFPVRPRLEAASELPDARDGTTLQRRPSSFPSYPDDTSCPWYFFKPGGHPPASAHRGRSCRQAGLSRPLCAQPKLPPASAAAAPDPLSAYLEAASHGRESAGAHPGWPGDRYYTYTELLAISRRFRQGPNELMVTWILRVYDQGGPALSLNSGELGLLGDLTHDAIFNYRCKALRGGCQTLVSWLLQAWRQRWESSLHFEATELPFRPWTTMEEGIQLVRELGMLEWIYLDPEGPVALAPEDVPFTQGLQRRLLTAAPSELRLSLVSLLVRGMTVLEAVMEIQTIADVGLLWRQSQPGRTKLMLGPNPTRKDLLGWLLSRGYPGSKWTDSPRRCSWSSTSRRPSAAVATPPTGWRRSSPRRPVLRPGLWGRGTCTARLT